MPKSILHFMSTDIDRPFQACLVDTVTTENSTHTHTHTLDTSSSLSFALANARWDAHTISRMTLTMRTAFDGAFAVRLTVLDAYQQRINAPRYDEADDDVGSKQTPPRHHHDDEADDENVV